MSLATGLPLNRVRGRRPVTWTTILGLVTVPLIVAGVFVWGLWNPAERLDTVTAAVVNNDEPVKVNGQLVPLGRLLAGELIGGGKAPAKGAASGTDSSGTDSSGTDSSGTDSSGTDAKNFNWTLTDNKDARAGLNDGRYTTVVTIPKNFSRVATSSSAGPEAARIANIDISESSRGRLIDTALSSVVTQTATNLLNKQLGSQFVGGVFVGMQELSSGVGQAADGAKQLSSGGRQLAQGATELASGAQQLSDGSTQLSSGATELATGTAALSSGASELSNGAAGLSAGVSAYAGGASELNAAYAQLMPGIVGVTGQLKTMIVALETLQADSAGPQQQLTAGMTAVAAGAVQLAGDGTAQNTGDIGSLYAKCLASGATQQFCDEMLGTLQLRATEIGGGLLQAQTAATGLGAAQSKFQASITDPNAPSGGDPLAQLDELAQGANAFGAGLGAFAAQGSQLSEGAAQLTLGASGFSAGSSQLATGAAALATGTSEFAANAPELAKGVAQLADGVGKSADGATELAGGLGDAVAQIPNYTEKQRDKLAETAIAPVEARGASDELFNASGAPLFAGVALWAGALASFLVLSPLWRRTREAAQGIGVIALRSALPAALLGAVQGAIAGAVLPIALGYDLAEGLQFFGLALTAGIAFALVIQGLVALLGGVGRFTAFALLVVAFVVGVVSTVPAPLAVVGDASPVGAAFAGFQAIAAGASGSGSAIAVLALWGLGGLLLTALAVRRARRSFR